MTSVTDSELAAERSRATIMAELARVLRDADRHTGLGRDFHEVGAGRLTQRLADFLRIAQAEGALGAADPHLLASHFLAPLRADLDDCATSPVADDAYVRTVVNLFCHGINGRK